MTKGKEQDQPSAAFIIPRAVNHTPYGSFVEAKVYSTDATAARRVTEMLGGTVVNQSGRSSRSFGMPTNWNAKWQPTGPDLAWMKKQAPNN